MKGGTNFTVNLSLVLFGFSFFCTIMTDQIQYSILTGKSIDSKIDQLNLEETEKTFKPSLIYRVEERMYFDIGFVINSDLHQSLKQLFSNVNLFFSEIAIEMSRIFSWNNMELSVKQFAVKNVNIDSFYYYNSRAYKNTINILQQDIEKPLDYYILYVNSSKHNSGHTFGKFTCTGYTVNIQNIQYIGELTAKNIAERTARDIIIRPHEFPSSYGDCECPYYNTEYCLSDKRYIYPSHQLVTKIFTKCEILTMLHRFGLYSACFFQKDSRPSLYVLCGDGVVHETEECDCGTSFMCKMTGQDNCCNHTTCKFKEKNYQCSHGVCCKDCRFKVDTICRDSNGECDPAEYCNGTSSECPINYVYEHYTMCNDNIGVCINGMCSNFDSLCKYVYNSNLTYFDESCYDVMLQKLRIGCESKLISEELNYTCNRLEKCQIFTCATKMILPYISKTSVFHDDKKFCMIPDEEMLIGWFAHAPNYLKCGNDKNHYCYDSICTDDLKLLKNCQDGYCRDINNSIQYVMKILYIFQANFMFQVKYNYGIYLNTVAKKVLIDYTKPLIISIFVLFTSIFIGVIIWKRKTIMVYYKKAKSTILLRKNLIT